MASSTEMNDRTFKQSVMTSSGFGMFRRWRMRLGALRRKPLSWLISRTIRRLRRMYGGTRRVHVLGDSHCRPYQLAASQMDWWRTDFSFCVVDGATAMGLGNPRSKTQAMPVFRRHLKSNVCPKDDIVFCLGEVDCGFVIWYRAHKHSLDIESQFDLAISNYRDLLNEASEICRRVLIASTPLPTIPDGVQWGEVAHARSEVKATLRERTDMTLRFNNSLREIAKEQGFEFIDFESLTIDSETRLIDGQYRHPKASDHHLDPEKMCVFIRARLMAHDIR